MPNCHMCGRVIIEHLSGGFAALMPPGRGAGVLCRSCNRIMEQIMLLEESEEHRSHAPLPALRPGLDPLERLHRREIQNALQTLSSLRSMSFEAQHQAPAIWLHLEECRICLEDLKGFLRENLFLLKCGHYFHKYCLLRWVAVMMGQGKALDQQTCPICKAHFNPLTDRCFIPLNSSIIKG